MIQYALKCADGHSFDSWFQSADAYERLAKSGLVSCAVCGSQKVDKAVMTPRVSNGKAALAHPASTAEQAMAELRRKIEQNADYVGSDFVREAQAIHDGDSPERAIYGEARWDEAKKLHDNGVPVMPLPFVPNRKTN